MKMKALKLVIAILALLLPARTFGQVGSTTDILMGRVAGLDSQAVTGARVEATSVESGITRTKTRPAPTAATRSYSLTVVARIASLCAPSAWHP
jgi:hypothetical protein